MSRAAFAEINLSALRLNLQRVRQCAPSARVLAVVKANGYGHGILRVARALDGADAFGVTSIDEALELRSAGISQRIVLLEGVFDASELPLVQQEQLDIVVHHETQLQLLQHATLDVTQRLRVWVKLDTGMHRLGFAPAQLPDVLRRLGASAGIAPEVTFITHLASADERGNNVTAQQVARFEEFTRAQHGARSMANSAGTLAWPSTHYDWVRPGLMLYGISPFADSSAAQEGLLPVMTIKSRLIAINRFKQGDAIGYGGSWTCPQDMSVGVVAFGYGDGYPRHAVSGTPVLVNGQRVALIGRVSMDMITVDLRSQAQVQVGDLAVLWGQGLPVEEVARAAATIPYELVCGITQRVRVTEVED